MGSHGELWSLFQLPTLTIQTGVLQVIGVGIVLHELGVSASCESAQRAGAHGGVKVGRSADEGELIQALILAIRAIGRRDFLDIADGQLQFLAGMPLEHVPSAGALPLRSAGCGELREMLKNPTTSLVSPYRSGISH